jgi:hypothetical protein
VILHGAIPQKIDLFIITAVRTTNPAFVQCAIFRRTKGTHVALHYFVVELVSLAREILAWLLEGQVCNSAELVFKSR